jgi:hypothetical protein
VAAETGISKSSVQPYFALFGLQRLGHISGIPTHGWGPSPQHNRATPHPRRD